MNKNNQKIREAEDKIVELKNEGIQVDYEVNFIKNTNYE